MWGGTNSVEVTSEERGCCDCCALQEGTPRIEVKWNSEL